jgi:hypothetical protein
MGVAARAPSEDLGDLGRIGIAIKAHECCEAWNPQYKKEGDLQIVQVRRK